MNTGQLFKHSSSESIFLISGFQRHDNDQNYLSLDAAKFNYTGPIYVIGHKNHMVFDIDEIELIAEPIQRLRYDWITNHHAIVTYEFISMKPKSQTYYIVYNHINEKPTRMYFEHWYQLEDTYENALKKKIESVKHLHDSFVKELDELKKK
jgi:hypothetical protein